MSFRKAPLALIPVVALGVGAALAYAATVTVPAKDASPTIQTKPKLVSRTDTVRISEKSPGGSALVRIKVYPSTYGFKPVNSSCQGKFMSARKRPSSTGSVVITLHPAKRYCRGIVYQAQALVGTGDVADKFAHFCVRGAETATTSGCENTYAR